MQRTFLRAKIHRATVTDTDVHYEGSVTIPPPLLAASGIMPYEAISVWNVTNGSRFETYAICGEEGSNAICVNGAAAHLTKKGDIIIIACFAELEEQEVAGFEPRLVFVDGKNHQLPSRKEVPGPRRAGNL